MSENKITVERYMDGFNRSDHALILSCLTDDVVWDMPGVYHHVGKDAFDQEIENPGFVGRPAITISRVVEEDDVVVAEGSRRRHHPACRTSGRLRDSPRVPAGDRWHLSLTPGSADNNVDLLAGVQEGDLAGVWAHSIITGPHSGGSFQAVRQ